MKFFLSLYAAKIVSLVSKTLGFGAGYTWAGHVALKLYSDLLSDRRVDFENGLILISGTNGKTTTAKLVTHILENSGHTVVHNATGANLLNGIASSVLLSFDWLGRCKADTGVFEVDEFSLPLVLKHFAPDVLVLLNLSRDQLDRYGETDIIFDKWQAAILDLPQTTKIVYYKDQHQFDGLAKQFIGRGGEAFSFDADESCLNHSVLKGSFNAKNINASLIACDLVGVSREDAINSLSTFGAAYGRGEVISYKGTNFHVYLAKNPASFNHNLDILKDFDPANTSVLVVLNDNIPDGRDVSWIYDIDTKLLHAAFTKFFEGGGVLFAGTRAYDMAIRFKYAGLNVSEGSVSSSLESALNAVVSNDEIQDVLVLPNYSAMLQLRKTLTGQNIL